MLNFIVGHYGHSGVHGMHHSTNTDAHALSWWCSIPSSDQLYVFGRQLWKLHSLHNDLIILRILLHVLPMEVLRIDLFVTDHAG